MPDLSIVIVNWNTRLLITQLLMALLTDCTEEVSLDIVVVDNASTDGSATIVAERFPQVRLVCNAENVGFARASNQGIAVTRECYVLLLNSDVVVPSGTMRGLVDFMDTHKDVGACSPRLMTANGDPQAYAFGDDPTLVYLIRRGYNRLLRNRPLHDWGISHVVDVDWVSGACLLLRKDVFSHVHGFDEAIFMYFEDVDLCLRIRKQGWRVCYVPDFQAIHLGGESLKQNPTARKAYEQSLKYFYHKHYSPISRGLLTMGLCVYSVLMNGLRRFISDIGLGL